MDFPPAINALLVLCLVSLLSIMPSYLSSYEVSSCPLADEIAAYFPVMEGYIAEVKEEKVFLDLGSDSGIRKGMEFLCIRAGKEFTHPITGAVLGRFEDKIGIIQIEEIEKEYSVGRILERFEGHSIKRADKVRISAARIPVAISITEAGRTDRPPDPCMESIVNEIRQGRRFSVAAEGSVAAVINELNVTGIEDMNQSQIKDLGQRLGISAIILLSVQGDGGLKIIHAQVISALTGARIASMSHEWRPAAPLKDESRGTAETPAQPYNASSGAIKRFLVPPPQGGILPVSRVSQEIPAAIRHMAIGDVTGDGKNEICITDGQDISILSWNGEIFDAVLQIKGQALEDHLSMDAADINGNGRAEIFVSSLERGEFLRSFVLEWQEGGLSRIWDKVPLYLRTAPVYPGRTALFAQGMGITDPFDSRCYEYQWENGRYASVRQVDLPQGANIFNIGMADLDGDGSEETASLARGLTIYRDKKKIWKSDAEYGGKSYFFEHKAKGALGMADEKSRVYLSSRLNIQDINGNGSPDIMLIKNTSSTGVLFPQSRIYRRGEACLIEWNGISFSEVWRSGEIEAYLTDIGIGDVNHDGSPDLVLSMVMIKGIGQFWKNSPSRILFF
ncbi:VCBS repeat-containing protein [bacterium]|nr:VCBS repeat-containing protein [bacterium]